MIRSPRFWLGIGVGVLGLVLLRGPAPGPKAFVGGWLNTPKPLRREGRLLRDQQARWSFRGGSSR